MQSHLELCRHNMIEQQVRPWDVLDDKVLKTLELIPRDQYVPPLYTGLAYADTAIPLGHGQYMMNPIIEGRLLQLLEIQPADKVLEIGTGSAYLTACLAHLAGHVDSVEINETLAQSAAEKLLEQGVFNISLSCADGMNLPAMPKKYDVIVLTGAVGEIPESFKLALKDDGRMFVVSGAAPAMQAHLITRTGDNSWADDIIFETVLPELIHGEKKPEFNF